MKLATLHLQAFRRFEVPQAIDLQEDLVALVGPNEAGKSSVLSALLLLNDTKPIEHQNYTRRSKPACIVGADFLLNDDDRAQLSQKLGGVDLACLRWWNLTKKADGSFEFELHDPPMTDRSNRRLLLDRLLSLTLSQSVRKTLQHDHFENLRQQVRQIEEVLKLPNLDLPQGRIEAMQRSATNALGIPDLAVVDEKRVTSRRSVARLRSVLQEVATFEEDPAYEDQIGNHLIHSRPRFHFFSQSHRELRSAYHITGIQNVQSEEPALANLLRSAGLVFSDLKSAMQEDNQAQVSSLLDQASHRLTERFSTTWLQENLQVRLAQSAGILRILVGPYGDFDYSELEVRSDGLRWFLALSCFLQQSGDARSAVLLIDEAETHLHYDAQVDLINLLEDQELVSKVIYSTHSAASLPRDLGRGVRVVEPAGYERSTMRSSIWGQGITKVHPGPTTIGHAMGAFAFSFLPARYVLMAEGETDAMLLPALFRDVAGGQRLGFQITPGLSVARTEEIGQLVEEAGKMAFIVDGDEGGDEIRRKLVESGVPESSIFQLSGYADASVAVELEDLIDMKAYADAVNSIIRDFQPGSNELDTAYLSNSVQRSKLVECWAIEQGISVQKTKIAQRLLDFQAQARKEGNEIFSLVDRDRRNEVTSLVNDLSDFFSQAS